MRFLLDTHLLLWAAGDPRRLSAEVLTMIEEGQNELFFSTVSIWETAIKHSRGRAEFQVEPGKFRRTLLSNDYKELTILGEHAVAVAGLPHIHKDPFDRLLIAQSTIEGIILLTADAQIARYGGLVQKV
jgi:PIN domain nuclease of toxin-antitoxin system